MTEAQRAEFPEANDAKYKASKPCNARIDELAKPNKRLVLGLWTDYAHNFSPERKEAIRLQVQELFAMSPEDTAKYFAEINKVIKKMAARDKFRERLARKYRARIWAIARAKAYEKFGKLLQRGMLHASKHTPPAFVSPRIRNMSDVILEQLCDIRGILVPGRNECDELSQFLVGIADSIAVAIEHIYYEIQVKKNSELDAIEAELQAQEDALKETNKTKSKASAGSGKRGADAAKAAY